MLELLAGGPQTGRSISRFLPRPARWPLRAGAAMLEWATGLRALGRVHARLGGGDPVRFLRDTLAWLDLEIDLPAGDLERVPQQGACLVVCNHPTGCLEGLLLLQLLTSVRRDVRVLANRWLGALPELAEFVLPIDVFGGRNDASTRAALRHLRGGGLLLAFPAGAVAARQLWSPRGREQPWAAGIGGLQRLAGARVVPVHVEAHVPSPWQFLGAVHPLVRTALLPRVLAAQRGAAVAVRCGYPIPHAQLERFGTDRERSDYLRLRSDILARRLLEHTPLLPGRPARSMAAVAGPECRRALLDEIAALPASSELLRSGAHTVRIARAAAIPVLLREIGRLRELAFRGVGEGSGLARDLDRFDRDYLHLFVWHETDQELVGAYRLGPTDELAGRGADGLYTATLYRFGLEFLARMQPALELGRSFVQPRYQKSHAALLLLWRGIGAFVAQQPRYRLLFGPVSISGQHDAASVRLIVAHLQAHCADPALQEHVTPRRPWRVPAQLRRRLPVDGVLLGDLDGVGAMVRELEVGRSQGVPVLLEQYLRLGARVVGCNLDPEFGTLDALVVVDLLRTPPERARRYLGEQGLRALQSWHGAPAGP